MNEALALPATLVARVAADEATARRLADAVLDHFGELAVSAFETPQGWAVEAILAALPDEAALRAFIAREAGPDVAGTLAVERITAKDWVAASLANLPPVRVGRFVIHGSHDRDRVPQNRIGIEIEAALAFGTGHHGTTRGCLLALDALLKARRPRRVLDIGTGTGILAIAAARARKMHVVASDIDAVAIRIARQNAKANRAGAMVDMFAAPGANVRRLRDGAPYDLIFANILVGPLLRMAAPAALLLAPGGHIILSGLLRAHANAVIAAYRQQHLRLERRIPLDEWVTLVMRRPCIGT